MQWPASPAWGWGGASLFACGSASRGRALPCLGGRGALLSMETAWERGKALTPQMDLPAKTIFRENAVPPPNLRPPRATPKEKQVSVHPPKVTKQPFRRLFTT